MEREKKRKIIIAAVVIVVMALIAVAIYFFLIRRPAEAPPAEEERAQFPTSREAQGILMPRKQEIVAKRITLLVDKAIAGSPALTATNKIRFFSKEDGKFYEADMDGSNQRAPYDISYADIVDATWNRAGTAALITTADAQEQKRWFIFDLTLERPRNVEVNKRNDTRIMSPALSDFDLGTYYYQFSDAQTSYGVISSANYNDSNYASPDYQYANIIESSVIPLRINEPKKGVISFYHLPSGKAHSSLYTYDSSKKQIKKLLNEIYGLSLLWGPTGDALLYSQTNNEGMGLAVYLANAEGQAISALSAATGNLKTVPEKCAFTASGGRLYCAVYTEDPSEIFTMPDAFYKGMVRIPEAVFRFDVTTGRSTFLADLAIVDVATKEIIEYSAEHLSIVPAENQILFVNLYDKYLYALNL